ncbi:hypothetical protein FZEAL_5622 [Fusarium zealandicum]|uniref:Nucleotide-diphospho-sugar transferase domain-containing protein n=1 Tax=Fusarium zealandicum TaxID=1053134 RepID=A0A8H4UKA0_9HYPO|nr:hypothetical protein FZEAL_5622 [Fusarium zealandicum]
MFGAVRTNRSMAYVAVAVIVLIAFVNIAYNHLDKWEPPAKVATDTDTIITPEHEDGADSGSSSKSENDSKAPTNLVDDYLNYMMKPSVEPTSPVYSIYGAFNYDLPANPKWTESIGEDLCIIDLDNRPFDEPGQIFSPNGMTWARREEPHGLSLGIMNHYVYAKIHGYKYYYIDITQPYEDRRNSWKKPAILAKILQRHKACIFLDSDAIFTNLDLPFEWLMNYWQLHPKTNSLALAADPNAKGNQDKFEKVYLNTGFIVLQNNEKTFEILKEWDDCPNEGGKHPECTEFRKNKPGKPTDQGGFGTFIRYDYPKDIKELACTEANGFMESRSGCDGKFIKHLWTGKGTWIKAHIGQQLPGALLETFHRKFIEEKKSFYVTETDLMAADDPK